MPRWRGVTGSGISAVSIVAATCLGECYYADVSIASSLTWLLRLAPGLQSSEGKFVALPIAALAQDDRGMEVVCYSWRLLSTLSRAEVSARNRRDCAPMSGSAARVLGGMVLGPSAPWEGYGLEGFSLS